MNSSNYLPEKQEKENPKNKKPKSPYLKFSFMITYILLLTTATITFIEALRTNMPIVRHIFNLETCISLVACYFYSLFVGKVEEAEKTGIPLDWVDITQMRYVDWSITTPMMLLALMVVLGYNSKTPVRLITITTVIILNYIMLYLGYLGEINVISRLNGMIFGFIAFFAMFFIIFMNFIKSKSGNINNILFGIYLVVWTMYGIVYMLDEETKNTIMNILDCISKCLIGIFLWVYYTGIVKA
jgi:bacteriorhodopsin